MPNSSTGDNLKTNAEVTPAAQDFGYAPTFPMSPPKVGGRAALSPRGERAIFQS